MQNNQKSGFGMTAMIIYMSILFAFLLVTTVNIYIYYKYHKGLSPVSTINPVGTKESHDNNMKIYQDYEKKIKDTAITYIYTYYQEKLSLSTLKIKEEDLINAGLMDEMIDPIDNTACSAYALISLKEQKIISRPYVKCANYMTEGYDKN